MESFAGALITAFWFGLLTAVSPCPLATNITAVSFIAKRVNSAGAVLRLGIWYAVGRMLAYSMLGSVMVAGLLSVPALSTSLQKYGHMLLGPLLIASGMVLLELIRFGGMGVVDESRAKKLAERGDLAGAGMLGFLFALAFCPVSAALFFGALLPLATGYRSAVAIPVMYGLGTALPVLISALILSQGVRMISSYFKRMAHIEWWGRRITGIVFILVGIYLSFYSVILVF